MRTCAAPSLKAQQAYQIPAPSSVQLQGFTPKVGQFSVGGNTYGLVSRHSEKPGDLTDACFAVFVTSLVMHFGPITFPSYVPELPKDFKPLAFAVMVLTACLLLLWMLAAIWAASHQGIRSTVRVLAGISLSEAETAILYLMAQDPTRALNLERIDYSRAPTTKLEFRQLSKGLQEKGLVHINPYDDNLASLTELGCEHALEIQRRIKGKGLGVSSTEVGANQ